MDALRARVEGGRVIVEDRVDLPDGEIYLAPIDVLAALSDAQRNELHEKLGRGSADIRAGRTVDAEEVLSSLRANRETEAR